MAGRHRQSDRENQGKAGAHAGFCIPPWPRASVSISVTGLRSRRERWYAGADDHGRPVASPRRRCPYRSARPGCRPAAVARPHRRPATRWDGTSSRASRRGGMGRVCGQRPRAQRRVRAEGRAPRRRPGRPGAHAEEACAMASLPPQRRCNSRRRHARRRPDLPRDGAGRRAPLRDALHDDEGAKPAGALDPTSRRGCGLAAATRWAWHRDFKPENVHR